jgi:hypothetical protein
MGLIYTAIILFAVAAMVGIYLLSCVLRGKETPKAFVFLHGALAATALVLLVVHTVKTGADLMQTIVLFALAALGGLVLVTRDLTGKTIPKSLAVVHGLVAVTGFVFLLVYTLNK